ncbi:MAG: 3-isopropylmalate dehydrogenase [Myxococcota bacterium]
MAETEAKRIVALSGDGVGPEVTEAAVSVLEAVRAPVRVEERAFGGRGIDDQGEPLPPETLQACREADAILLGAVGGPKWDGAPKRPEAGLLVLRRELELFANLRPVRIYPSIARASSPLRPERLEGVDLLVVRELTGGIYFGEPRRRWEEDDREVAIDTCRYDAQEVRRIAALAFQLAGKRRQKVTSVDKANVLATSKLWREIVTETAQAFPEVQLDHQLVDSAAMRLITHASSFDVILTGNMFGDILSDESAVLTGSIGLLPSASMGSTRKGLYEPIHGSAPDIAGQGKANPVGAILSAAMMLDLSLGRADLARRIEQGVAAALDAGARTVDLGGTLSTREMTRAITSELGD